MAALVLVIGLAMFVIATATYGTYLEKTWGIDESIITPAHRLDDGNDYHPGNKLVTFGHHFAAIAGAAPIIGAITASKFGWLPVVLWCIIGSIFVGGVQDYGAMFVSVRHDASTIGQVIYKYTGLRAKRVFCVFAFFSTVLLSSSFIDIISATFISTPSAGSCSLILIALAVGYGFATNKFGMSTLTASLIFVPLTFLSVWAGVIFPVVISKTAWMWVLIAYAFIASVTPMWAMLQPRSYLNSYVLAAMMVAAVVGIVIYRPEINMPVFTSFVVDGQPLFPTLFVVFACGACSGIHSLVSSGTTSKQIANEKDMKFIGYFGMMLEGMLALISVITVMFLTSEAKADIMTHGAIFAFGNGLATFLGAMNIPYELGITFANMSVAAFALTTMDSAIRLARYLFQEFIAGNETVQEARKKGNIFMNNNIAALVPLTVASGMAFLGYQKIWTLFGTANQLLTSMAFMGIMMYLKDIGKKYTMITIPMIWMAAVGTVSGVFTIYWNIGKNWLVVGICVLLLIASVFLYKEVYKSLTNKKERISESN